MQKLLAQFTIEGDDKIPAITIGGVGTNFDNSSIGNIIGDAVPYIFIAAGIGLLLMIISSGFSIMMSAGDAKKAGAGKTTLTNSIIGFLIVFAAFWITQILGVALGWGNIETIFGQ